MKNVTELDPILLAAALRAVQESFPDNAVIIIVADERNSLAGTTLNPGFAKKITEGALTAFDVIAKQEETSAGQSCH